MSREHLARLRARLRARAADPVPRRPQGQDDDRSGATDRVSRGREHLALQQRQRRARKVRIDYMPGDAALMIIEAKRGTEYPLNTNSGIIDAILTEWADLTGINNQELETSKCPGLATGNASEQEFGGLSGTIHASSCARARAYEYGKLPQHKVEQERRQAARRIVCGARRHRDGQPCQAKSEPGKLRCRFHGGSSTGPRTTGGRARALANLRQYACKGAE